jgi:hypothetical protein
MVYGLGLKAIIMKGLINMYALFHIIHIDRFFQ